MSDAACPYCHAPLPKMPQRKSKCKACGQFIFIKNTPDDPERRLMTEAQAAAAEQKWHQSNVVRQVINAAVVYQLDEAVLLAATRACNWDLNMAIRTQIAPAAQNGDYQAIKEMVRLSSVDEERLHWRRQQTRLDIAAARSVSAPGHTYSHLSIAPPDPPAGAAFMLELEAQGYDASIIAIKTGSSPEHVRSVLKNHGAAPARSALCKAHTERQWSIDEALEAMPVPCDVHCVCHWVAVLKKDMADAPHAARPEAAVPPAQAPQSVQPRRSWLRWFFWGE